MTVHVCRFTKKNHSGFVGNIHATTTNSSQWNNLLFLTQYWYSVTEIHDIINYDTYMTLYDYATLVYIMSRYNHVCFIEFCICTEMAATGSFWNTGWINTFLNWSTSLKLQYRQDKQHSLIFYYCVYLVLILWPGAIHVRTLATKTILQKPLGKGKIRVTQFFHF